MERMKEALTKMGIAYVSENLGGNIEGLQVAHNVYIVKHGSDVGYYFGDLEDESDTSYTLEEVLELVAKYKED